VAEHSAAGATEAIPPGAEGIFGSRLALTERLVALLTGPGVERGLLGPRESARIWTRHVLNCAVVAELFDTGQRVVDVGSGAGLPGLPIALARPDLRLQLVEPLQRRVDFLLEAVGTLGLGEQVEVLRGRAEEPATIDAVRGADWVTARAVAPLDPLVRWCLPLAAPRGRLALIKGASAADELDRSRSALRRAGARNARAVMVGAGQVEPAVTVVTIETAETSRGTEHR
jgi:16S rRNA (guanine527-N7)-methyltransferase